MSHIDDIGKELGSMAAGIKQATGNTAAADNAAHQVAQKAAASGFVGVAQAMGRVRDAIKEIHGRLTGISGSINEAQTPLGAAPKQMSPEQTVSVLAPIAEKIAAIHGDIGATISKVNQTETLTAATLRGGQPGPMLSRLGAIRLVLEAVLPRCATAKQHVQTALAQAHKTGDTAKN